MNELTKLLDGSVEGVKAGLAGKSREELLTLKSAEENGKTRKGVLEALEEALANTVEPHSSTAASAAASAITSTSTSVATDNSGPTNVAPAETIDPSGAPDQIVPDVEMEHRAVDNDPRAGTTATMNRIDFNDPAKSGRDAVAEMLKGRGEG